MKNHKKKIIGIGCIIIGACLFFLSSGKFIPPSSNFSSPLGRIPSRSTPSNIFQGEPSVRLASLFDYFSPADIKDSLKDEFVLLATGDVIPARSVNSISAGKNDFTYPYAKTADFLKRADITFINLETPLFSECIPTIEGMKFCANTGAVEGLVYAGVDVASLANNHAGNYGADEVVRTKELLEKNKILVTGTGEPAMITIRGKTFGFLGFNDIGNEEKGIAWANIPTIEVQVRSLKKRVDFVIVTFHWGIEYTTIPSDRQKELAHIAIDSGADLIIGNHPHWVQGVELYREKMITYAHGNFIFDQMWSRETREGVIGRYTFGKSGLKKAEFYPIIIENYSQPRFATQKEANKILERMKTSSDSLAIK